jgi:hypothetical protein
MRRAGVTFREKIGEALAVEQGITPADEQRYLAPATPPALGIASGLPRAQDPKAHRETPLLVVQRCRNVDPPRQLRRKRIDTPTAEGIIQAALNRGCLVLNMAANDLRPLMGLHVVRCE